MHRLENPRSQRVPWLLDELGLDYEVKRGARDAPGTGHPRLQACLAAIPARGYRRALAKGEPYELLR